MILIMNILRSISGMLVTAPMFILIAVLFWYLYVKNKKMTYMQNIICGGSVDSTLELTLSQIVLGILGGCAASIVLGLFGVVFNDMYSIILLFYISLMLMLIKPRLVCFSYSGFIVGLISIIIQILNSNDIYLDLQKYFMIDIVSLVTFIGVLHVIEGLLVMLNGYKGAVPVFAEKNGEILGGYSLKRYWAVPIIFMTIIAGNNPLFKTYPIYDIPKWWADVPYTGRMLIGSGIGIILSNFFGIIGYSSITFTKSKKQKAFSSGIFISLFGILAVCMAQFARYGVFAKVVVISLVPIAHEFMFYVQRKFEQIKQPKFISDESGLTILEIADNSVFKDFNVKVGSKIHAINNKIIQSEQELYKILKENLYNAVIDIIDTNGNKQQIKFRHKKNKRLGIVLVPKFVQKEEALEVSNVSFENILEEIRKKQNKI